MLQEPIINILVATAWVMAFVGAVPQLAKISEWGHNPTNLSLDVYIPDPLPQHPAVILLLHACSFSGPFYNEENNYTSYADEKGFIALFPSTPNEGHCWDVASNRSLTRSGNGDSTGLANMIQWAMSKYGADPARIFITGSSSGCMMTNVMCSTYPDVFAAASCYSGFPAGCLAGSPGSSPGTGDPGCGAGTVNKTGTEWAAQVRDMYPEYTGPYPRTAIWHGTADVMVSYNNLEETLEQWSTVVGVTFTQNITNSPDVNITKIVYGDGEDLVGYSAEGIGHTVPCYEETDLEWFGL